MVSRADKRDSRFLDDFKNKINLETLNDSNLDYFEIIKSLSSTNATGAPDYVFEQGYVEKFDLYDSERINVKRCKKQYLHLLAKGLLDTRIKKDKKNKTIASNYYAGDELKDIKESRTSIGYLHQNLREEIQEKTGKISAYEKNVNCANINGLLINVNSAIEVFKYPNGDYVTTQHDMQKNNFIKEPYQVFKNLKLMQEIKDAFASNWRFFLFVKYYSDIILINGEWKQIENYYTFAIDLSMPINEKKMINYPHKILHLQEGLTECHYIKV